MNLVHEYVLQGCAMSSTNFFLKLKKKFSNIAIELAVFQMKPGQEIQVGNESS